MRMIRVSLADDEVMIRAGIAAILTSGAGIEVVSETSDGAEAIEAAKSCRPDVAVLDIRMPVVDGLTAAEEIRRAVPGTRIVMLTTFDEDDYVDRALRIGVSGFLLKASDPRELLIGVRAVVDGAAYLSPRIAQRIIAGLPDRRARRVSAERAVSTLSRRETEVLTLLAHGLSNSDIARRLHLAEGTVKAHVSAILLRLSARNRVQAAIFAYQAGLID
ncbi:Protease production enhancer protein [Stackebrandtia soli]